MRVWDSDTISPSDHEGMIGLGENDGVVDIFIEHTRKAVLMFRDG